MNVKLIGLPHIGSEGKYYGIQFEAIGKGKLSADNKRFTGITLVAEVEEDIAKSLIDADKVEEISDAELKALKTKVAKAEKADK